MKKYYYLFEAVFLLVAVATPVCMVILYGLYGLNVCDRLLAPWCTLLSGIPLFLHTVLFFQISPHHPQEGTRRLQTAVTLTLVPLLVLFGEHAGNATIGSKQHQIVGLGILILMSVVITTIIVRAVKFFLTLPTLQG